jgi:hypothetical protein
VLRRGGTYEAFVNTCGSEGIVEIADRSTPKIPIYLIAENNKITDLGPTDPMPRVSFIEEEAIFGPIDGQISEMRALGQKIAATNFGYDLCTIVGDIKVITEL